MELSILGRLRVYYAMYNTTSCIYISKRDYAVTRLHIVLNTCALSHVLSYT
ncbi:hypothetical protein WH47_01620 [Habropoda laboriosa]|uniref:Uncharacterized protein n=1 Tax=Habropoda laboriosa TaxID=597456 RepID=A0A0L7R0S7_9HYME|nr:hypothetical protein WH47_01620 [Habropoda laboriosa]